MERGLLVNYPSHRTFLPFASDRNPRLSLADDIHSDYTGRTREPFSVRVWGRDLYILTRSEDVTAALNNNITMSFDGHLNNLLLNFGIRGEALRLTWLEPKPGDREYLPEGLIFPRQKSLIRLTEEVYRQQLLPGSKMNVMSQVFLEAVCDSISWSSLDNLSASDGQRKSNSKIVSMRTLCRRVLVDAAIRSLFGRHLHEINPAIVDDMSKINDNVWMIIFGYPEILSSEVNIPRTRMLNALEAFIRLPEECRFEQAWSIQTILRAQEVVGLDIRSRASVLLMITWA